LKNKARKLFGEIDHMLAGAAGDFENDALVGQNVTQHLKNGAAIALGGGELKPMVGQANTLSRECDIGISGVCHQSSKGRQPVPL
jgi:hypothetical protein